MMTQRISPEEARQLMEQQQTRVIDIRDPQSFASGHIEGAIQLRDDNVATFLAETPKETPLIVCCYHGISSQQAAAYFSQQGFAQAYSLDGGYEAWESLEAQKREP
jgi:thiosulfate sulfurtransferase